MARKQREVVQSKDIRELMHFDQLALLHGRLHEERCARDRAGNLVLRHDQHVMLIMLGSRHLLSHSENGIEIQAYFAIIAYMLISR